MTTTYATLAMERLWEQCKARENDAAGFTFDASGNPRRNGQLFGIDRATYDMWKANAGNARARRRWRRRNLPNTQREAAKRKEVPLGPGRLFKDAEDFHRHLRDSGTSPGGPRLRGITPIGPGGVDWGLEPTTGALAEYDMKEWNK